MQPSRANLEHPPSPGATFRSPGPRRRLALALRTLIVGFLVVAPAGAELAADTAESDAADFRAAESDAADSRAADSRAADSGAADSVAPGSDAADSGAADSDVPAQAGARTDGERHERIARRIQLLRTTAPPTTLAQRLTSGLGLLAFIGLSFLFSLNRRAVAWRVVIWGAVLQLLFAIIVLKTGPGRAFFVFMNDLVLTLLRFTEEGARFIFGNLVRSNVPVGTPVGDPNDPSMGAIPPDQVTGWAATGGFFAFNVLPTIIFFSSLMSVLYHLRIMPLLVRAMAWVMSRTMGTSGAESLSASANIFVGQTEAPLVIRPYVPRMTMSELHAVMVGGFATVAGGVMAAYVGMLSGSFPDIAGHLIAASVMSAPAALAAAKLFLPETEISETRGRVRAHIEIDTVNVVDAATRGAGVGLRLALNVGAMLLAFIALVAMLNHVLGLAGGLVGIENLSMQRLLSWIFWPAAWLLGVPPAECAIIGQLLGERMVLNEFVAYYDLANMLEAGKAEFSYRGVTIATYALCGFANFSSIAIQIGGIGAIAEGRRQDLARVGVRAMIAATVASLMTASVAGLLL